MLEALLAAATTAADFSGGDDERFGKEVAAPVGAGGALLGDGRVVEHGHSLHAQQQGQTPRNHVVEDDGAGGQRKSHETAALCPQAVCACVCVCGEYDRVCAPQV